ncbi:MAG TPA: hypothetical protein VIG25_10760 [Pyrinomonadaceae bacterium]
MSQTRPKKATAPAATQVVPTLMASLPESDGVADVKVRQLLNEVLPQLLATNPTKLAEINADIDRFKTRTGLDPRMFDELAMGVTYSYPAEGITKLHTAALAKGQFSSGAMIAAGRVAANGKYREEKYQGKTIYVFNIDESIKVLGLFDFSVREIAAAPLNTNTLALGDPTTIRNVIDVAGGRKRNNAELIALASREPNAIIGFGSNLSPTLIKNLDVGNASIAADLSGLRQVYGSVGTTPRDFDIFLGARTVNADAARNLGDTLEGLKQLGGLFVGRLSGAKGVLAKSALSNLKISTQANELQIRTAVAQAELAPLVGN